MGYVSADTYALDPKKPSGQLLLIESRRARNLGETKHTAFLS